VIRAKEPFLWFSRVGVETSWKHETGPAFANRCSDTRIFSPLAVPRLYVPIGRYWFLFKRLTAVSAGRSYRFEHIETYSSGQVVAKSADPNKRLANWSPK